MKRAFAGAGLFIVLACTIGACVGDDPNPTTSERQPDPSITPGLEGGACTADQKCLEGLDCVRGVICLPPEDGGTSSTDGGGSTDGNTSTDATTSDGGDAEAGASCSYTATNPNNEVKCGNVFCPGNVATRCCLGQSGQAMCATPCGMKKIACDSADECTGSRCCLAVNLALTKASACSSGVDYATLGDTHCGPCDGTNEYRVCRNDADCADLSGPPTCTKVELKNTDAKITMGICL